MKKMFGYSAAYPMCAEAPEIKGDAGAKISNVLEQVAYTIVWQVVHTGNRIPPTWIGNSKAGL